jgi:hypothetical protein
MEQEKFDEIIDDIRCSVFHMNDEEAAVIVRKYLKQYPGLLEFHSEEWFLKYL